MMLGYVVATIGLVLLFSGVTGKLLPLKKPAMFETPQVLNRIICVWLGLLFGSAGVFLIVEGVRS